MGSVSDMMWQANREIGTCYRSVREIPDCTKGNRPRYLAGGYNPRPLCGALHVHDAVPAEKKETKPAGTNGGEGGAVSTDAHRATRPSRGGLGLGSRVAEARNTNQLSTGIRGQADHAARSPNQLWTLSLIHI
eukprot:688883-Rhodomonas_salina.1